MSACGVCERETTTKFSEATLPHGAPAHCGRDAAYAEAWHERHVMVAACYRLGYERVNAALAAAEAQAKALACKLEQAEGERDEARRRMAESERLLEEEIENRDRATEWADDLSTAIAGHLGIDIGEHTNLNAPWVNAIEALRALAPAPERAPTPTREEGPDLRALLGEAIDFAGEGWAYAGRYFQEKYDLEGNLTRLRAGLAAFSPKDARTPGSFGTPGCASGAAPPEEHSARPLDEALRALLSEARGVAGYLFCVAREIEAPPWSVTTSDPETLYRWMQRSAADAIQAMGPRLARIDAARDALRARPTPPPASPKNGGGPAAPDALRATLTAAKIWLDLIVAGRFDDGRFDKNAAQADLAQVDRALAALPPPIPAAGHNEPE